MRALKIALTAAMLLFLVLSPPLILQKLGVDEYRAYWEKPDPEWKGRIEIWHIASFRTYQGSVTNQLQARATAYCKSLAGVDIDVVGLTLEKYRDRIARGLTPDAYSFQGGLLYAEQLSPLPQSDALSSVAFRGNLAVACVERKAYAAPYLMSGLLLAQNRTLTPKLTSEPIEAPYDALLQNAILAGQLAMPPFDAARYSLVGTLADETAFTKGDLALCVIDARKMGDQTRSEKFTISADYAPLGSFTDQVFYLGASRTASPEQIEALGGFIAFMLSDDEQAKLCSLGGIPVTIGAEAVFTNDALSRLNEALLSPVVPDAFLYQRHGDALLEEAIASVGGDADAARSFLERLALVCLQADANEPSGER